MPITLSPAVASSLGSLFRSAIGRAAPAAVPAARSAIAAVGRAGGAIARQLPAAIAPSIVGGAAGAIAARGATARGGYVVTRRRRAKGITAAELRGARKVAALVRMYGMKPKSGKIGGRRRR